MKDSEIRARFVELSVDILKQTPNEENKNLRNWATQIIDKHSEIPLSAQTKKDLIENIPITQAELDSSKKQHSFPHPNQALPDDFTAAELTIKEWDIDLAWQNQIWLHLLEMRNAGKLSSEDSHGYFAVADNYLASCFLLNIKPKHSEIDLDSLSGLAQKQLPEFVTLLSKDSSKKNYFLEQGVDASSWGVVNFRIRLGELIYWNWQLEDVKYKLGQYSLLFPTEKRTPERVEKLWKMMKPILFRLVSRERYKQNQWNRVVDGLLDSHNSIIAKDYKSIFKNIMIEKSKGGLFNECPESIRSEKVDGVIIAKNGWKGHFTSWFYSFWYRRYLEGTMSISYEILKEVKEHYNKG